MNNLFSNSFLKQLIKYSLVALTAFTIDITLLYILTDIFEVFYLFSATLSFTAGLFTNYILSINFVFSERRIKNSRIEFLLNSSIALSGLFLNLVIIWFLTDFYKIYYLYSKLVSTALVFWWNFLMKRFFLFTKPNKVEDIDEY